MREYVRVRVALIAGVLTLLLGLGSALVAGHQRAELQLAQTADTVTLSESECIDDYFSQGGEWPDACDQYYLNYTNSSSTAEPVSTVSYDTCVQYFESEDTWPAACEQYYDAYMASVGSAQTDDTISYDQCVSYFEQGAVWPVGCEQHHAAYEASIDTVDTTTVLFTREECISAFKYQTSWPDECDQYHDDYTASQVVEDSGTVDDPIVPGDSYAFTAPACPFRPETGRLIVDFTRGGSVAASDLVIRANSTRGDAVQVWSDAPIAAGTYTVSLASYDVHGVVPTSDSLKEQWSVELYDKLGKRIYASPPARDIAAHETKVIERVAKDVSIDREVYKVVGRHYAYPNSTAHRFLPLCVALDRPDLEEVDASNAETEKADSETVLQTPVLHFFYSPSCPHCVSEAAFLDVLEQGYPELVVRRYDVTSSTLHQSKMRELASQYGVTEYTGTVPLTFVGTGAFQGFDSVETTGKAIEVASRSLLGIRRTDATRPWMYKTKEVHNGEVQTVNDEADEMDELAPTYAQCPLPAQEGRTVIDFTRGGTVPLTDLTIVADGARSSAMRGPVATYLSPGTYTVRVASHNTGATTIDRQQWVGVFYDTSDRELVRTSVSPDVPTWETVFISKTQEEFVLESAATRFAAFHAAYPGSSAHGVAVLCASFDRSPSHTETMREPVERSTQEGVLDVNESTISTRTTVELGSGVGEDIDVSEQSVRDVVPTDPTVKTLRDRVATDSSLPLFSELDRAGSVRRAELAAQLLAQDDTATYAASTSEASSTLMRRPVREAAPVPADEETRAVLKERLVARTGVAAFRDTDGDGVTDYDEVSIYGTDPEHAFTAGGVLTDGERLLLGLDPQATGTVPVVAESPKVAGDVVEGLFPLDTLLVTSAARVALAGTASTSSALRVRGMTKPLSFVTLYIFSTPIVVTVRSDDTGVYEYVFDETLEDGTHELYVATVDTTGKVIAKSNAVPFTKTAEAYERTDIAQGNVSSPIGPVETATRTSVVFVLFTLLVVALMTVALLGAWLSRRHTVPEHE